MQNQSLARILFAGQRQVNARGLATADLRADICERKQAEMREG